MLCSTTSTSHWKHLCYTSGFGLSLGPVAAISIIFDSTDFCVVISQSQHIFYLIPSSQAEWLVVKEHNTERTLLICGQNKIEEKNLKEQLSGPGFYGNCCTGNMAIYFYLPFGSHATATAPLHGCGKQLFRKQYGSSSALLLELMEVNFQVLSVPSREE